MAFRLKSDFDQDSRSAVNPVQRNSLLSSLKARRLADDERIGRSVSPPPRASGSVFSRRQNGSGSASTSPVHVFDTRVFDTASSPLAASPPPFGGARSPSGARGGARSPAGARGGAGSPMGALVSSPVGALRAMSPVGSLAARQYTKQKGFTFTTATRSRRQVDRTGTPSGKEATGYSIADRIAEHQLAQRMEAAGSRVLVNDTRHGGVTIATSQIEAPMNAPKGSEFCRAAVAQKMGGIFPRNGGGCLPYVP